MTHQPLREMVPALEINPQNTTGAAQGTGVDMLGFNRVVFIATVGVFGNGATFDLRAVESANSNFSGNVNIANAAITQVANTAPNIVLMLDVPAPSSGNRYVKVIATPGTNNANYGVISLRYRAQGRVPVTLPTNHQHVIL